MVFQRINEQDKEVRRASKDLEFIWAPEFTSIFDDSYLDKQEIFTHVLYDTYHTPRFVPKDWFKYGNFRKPEEVTRVAKDWIDFFQEETEAFRTPNIFMIWGDDFSHRSNTSFDILDTMIEAVNAELVN